MIYNTSLLRIAQDHNAPNYLRIPCYVAAHLGIDGGRVILFESDELRSNLPCPSRKSPGEMVAMGKSALSRAIKEGVERGYLVEGSKPRRVELSSEFVRSRFD